MTLDFNLTIMMKINQLSATSSTELETQTIGPPILRGTTIGPIPIMRQ